MLGFRVWDIENKKIYYPEDTYGFVLSTRGELLDLNMIGVNNCIPMQSTGFKDFNDKEIFEGDLLFIYFHTESKITNEYYLVSNITDFLIYIGRNDKIIYKISNDGNIYEQPSLLDRLK